MRFFFFFECVPVANARPKNVQATFREQTSKIRIASRIERDSRINVIISIQIIVHKLNIWKFVNNKLLN